MLILYVLSSPPPFQEINITDIINKRKEEEKINEKKRKLASTKVAYKNPESYITIYNDYIIETLSLIAKAEGGTVTSFNIHAAIASKFSILSCDLKMYDDRGNQISTFSNITNCSSNINNIIINTFLKENYELLVKVKFKGINKMLDTSSYGILYQQMMIEIPSQFGNNTHCKYLFNVDTTNSVLIQAQYEVFQKYNDSAYIYDKLCPNSFIFDFFKITAKQINWNYYSKVTAEIGGAIPEFLYFSLQNAFFDGTNFNTTEKLSYTPIKNGTRNDDEFISNYKFHILHYYNFNDRKNFYFTKNVTFSSSPIFWNITEEAIKENLKNISTEQTINLAKTILAEDTSDKPDYYKLGKWVYNNMEYNKNHNTKTEPDDIIAKRVGVCAHFTVLYNALLNSIGIKALDASGEAIQNSETLKRENHGWTVAFIDGKWIGLDATWNIFSGILPQCHLFRKFEGVFPPIGFFVPRDDSNNKINQIEELKLVEIVNFSSNEKTNAKIDSRNDNIDSNNANTDSQKGLVINILFLFIILLIYS